MVGKGIVEALDDPVGSTLRGAHAHLARRSGRVATYQLAVATFSAVPPDPTARDWEDLAALLGPGRFADLFSSPATPPDGWEPVFRLDGFQMVADGRLLRDAPDVPSDLVELDVDDVPAMLDLVEETRPGPFWERTHEMGRYVGIRDHDRLAAMAGERLRPPGWTEISAVCTTGPARGRGLAATLVREVARGVLARGDRPFLHVAATNTSAIRVYERLGFRVRREVVFRGYRTPA